MPKPPPNLKIKRAKTIVDNTGIKVLAECERCGEEKYIEEDERVCEECKARPKRKRAK